jgi:hypothetical protein
MSILCASARNLNELAQKQQPSPQQVNIAAQDVAQRIQAFLTSMEEWTSKVSEPWRPVVVDAHTLQQPDESTVASNVPKPRRILKYADAWLAYMWNCK